MKDYNKIISELRVIARDGLRLKAVNRFRTSMLDENVTLKGYKDSKASAEKCIAIAKFAISKLDPEDPQLEDFTEINEDRIKRNEKSILEYDRCIAATKERIEEIKEKVAKIESGETLIRKDKLADVTHVLIEELTYGRAKKMADETEAPEVDDED